MPLGTLPKCPAYLGKGDGGLSKSPLGNCPKCSKPLGGCGCPCPEPGGGGGGGIDTMCAWKIVLRYYCPSSIVNIGVNAVLSISYDYVFFWNCGGDVMFDNLHYNLYDFITVGTAPIGPPPGTYNNIWLVFIFQPPTPPCPPCYLPLPGDIHTIAYTGPPAPDTSNDPGVQYLMSLVPPGVPLPPC